MNNLKQDRHNTTKKRKTDQMNNISYSGTPIYVFNGVVPSNPLITTLEEKLKPYIFHFLDSVRQ